MADGIESTRKLRPLTAAIGAFLVKAPVPPLDIDADGMQLAVSRHGIGLLLLAAAPDSLEETAREKLRAYRNTRKKRQAVEALLLKPVDDRLTAAGIPWIVLKGAPQARRLYGDASLRPSSDIDILVPPEHFAATVAAMQGLGWRYRTPPRGGLLPRLALKIIRDVELLAPGNSPVLVELHQRALQGAPFAETGANLMAEARRDPLPAPELSAALAYYLFAHGALCYWARLKWLTDFALILPALPAEAVDAVLTRAVAGRTAHSLAASILLAGEFFPPLIAARLTAWAEGLAGQAKVQRRLKHYRAAVAAENPGLETPLHNRMLTLQANLLFFEAPGRRLRLLATAPFLTLFRLLAGLGHG